MKDLFPGYFKESEGHLREVWDSSLFVFDANILLNLYRYSDSTQNEFLRILGKIKGRVWLPHRAAEEYLNNRLSVIDQQEKSYDDTKKSIETLKSNLENSRQHPFVGTETMSKVGKVFDELCTELEKNKAVHTQRISDDDIKMAIASIFENRVGSPYEKSRLEEIMSEGEERYRQAIPPGFKDSSKAADSEIFVERCRKYGDLIVWLQVIDKAIESAKGIVLVTDDKKEDWWERFKGKTIGPRPELVKEFKDRTGHTFHMYQADRFLELARENLGEQVSEDAVEEIREIKRLDTIQHQESMKYRKHQRKKIEMLRMELAHIKQKMMRTHNERQALQLRLHNLEGMRADAMRNDGSPIVDTKDIDLESISQLSDEYAQARQKFEMATARYHAIQMDVETLEGEISRRIAGLGRAPEEFDWPPSDQRS